jgi:hypothetical protein
MPPEMAGALQQVRDMPAAAFVIGSLLLTLFICPIFSMLGDCSALRSLQAARSRSGASVERQGAPRDGVNFKFSIPNSQLPKPSQPVDRDPPSRTANPSIPVSGDTEAGLAL